MRKPIIGLLILGATLTGCSVNPVTGDRDFMIVSGDQEVAMGEQNYAPMLQSPWSEQTPTANGNVQTASQLYSQPLAGSASASK